MSISTKYGGLKIVDDTGPPQDVDNYTTLILFHGFSFHSGIFSRLLPFAAQHKCRIVLVNRRGYPGAESHTPEDLQLLRAAQDSSPHGVETLSEFLKHSAHSIFTLLESFVAEERAPISGGIVLVGWSICGVLMTSLLASASSFSSKFDLSPYIKRVVTFDSPYHALGFARPPGSYNPLDDDAIPPQDRGRHFGLWVSGYYDHPSPTTYEQHTALQHSPPTLSTMTPSDFAETLAPEPSTPPDGPDFLMFVALPFGAAREMRRAAMSPPTSDRWGAVEWRHVWCDRSGWEMPFAAKSMREEIAKMDDGEESRDKVRRKVVLVRWRGANHFAHWDYPEQTLKALLEDGREDVQVC